MARRKRDRDIQDELHLGYEADIDRTLHAEEETPEQEILNTVLNSGEDVARNEYGDDKIDKVLLRRGLAR